MELDASQELLAQGSEDDLLEYDPQVDSAEAGDQEEHEHLLEARLAAEMGRQARLQQARELAAQLSGPEADPVRPAELAATPEIDLSPEEAIELGSAALIDEPSIVSSWDSVLGSPTPPSVPSPVEPAAKAPSLMEMVFDEPRPPAPEPGRSWSSNEPMDYDAVEFEPPPIPFFAPAQAAPPVLHPVRAPRADREQPASAPLFEEPPALEPSLGGPAQPGGIASVLEAMAGGTDTEAPTPRDFPSPHRPARLPGLDEKWMEAPEGEAVAYQGETKTPPAVEGGWNAALSPEDELAIPGDEPFYDDDGEIVTDPKDVRARRQRLLRRAFDNLGVLPRPPAVEGGVVETPSSVPSAASPAPTAAKIPTLSPEEIALAKKIEARHIGIGREELFVRLGLQRDANGEQAKAAYFALVKVFHPDRLPPALANLAPKVKDIFAALTEAYETLQDDARRSVYLMRLSAPSQSAPKASDLEVTLKQAEVLLKKKEFVAAAELFGKAFAESNKAHHLAMQAWAMYLDPAQRPNMQQIKTKLEQALRLDRECDRAHYTLGVIARVENDLVKAEKHFRS
ncbi:MAG TPA: hypothetical protein DFS52_29150, partial [Myxococcales bacterium]|nr:hypothetical protein [Myxococcales bacterium]